MKPICVPCERFMRPKKSGFYFIEGMPTQHGLVKRGKGADGWKPYKIWCGDLWACPDCRAEIIVSVGFAPLSEHYQPEFAVTLATTGAERLLIKDC
jgi:hypothetical protein